MTPNPELPIDAYLPQVRDLLAKDGGLVLVAEPGAGKTTRVPRALLAGDEKGEVLVLEPRRLAARLSAMRVADELGERVGERVGYSVRFDEKTSAATRLRFLTEGIFIRRLTADPHLRGVSTVVFDEFHERSVDADLAFAWTRALQKSTRPDLRIVVMSATINADPLAAFLGASVLRVPGRTFPVTIEYAEKVDTRYVEDQVASAVRRLVVRGLEGDLLVFLPGAGEIRRAMDACAEIAKAHDAVVVALHGDLPPAEQDKAVRAEGKRKIILSTNIAETSLTLPRVTAVVDSGQARVATYSPWSGLPRLTTARISRASAEQRAGRAGRVREGTCVRLYTKGEFLGFHAHDVPEIRRADFAAPLLLLRCFAPRDLVYFETPPAPAMAAAEKLLVRLGALTAAGDPTDLGRKLAELPVHPRLGRVLEEGRVLGVLPRACLMAALISERELRLAARTSVQGRGHGIDDIGSSDVLARLESFECVEAEGGDNQAMRRFEVDRMAYEGIRRVRDQLVRAVGCGADSAASLDVEDPLLRRALLSGYPDRVGKRRDAKSNEVVFAEGGAGRMADTSVVRKAEFMVVIDVDEGTKGGASIRVASAIESDWLLELAGDGMSDERIQRFDPKRERVVERVALCYGKLSIEDSERHAAPSEGTSRILREVLRGKGLGLICDLRALDNLKRRAAFAHKHDKTIPEIDDLLIDMILETFTEGAATLDELRKRDFLSTLRAEFGEQNFRTMNQLAPAHVSIPGRAEIPVNYDEGKPPWIASRMQDFFGLADGPKVANGRETLVLHLLAPNQRAEQVTTDLAGFWKRHYPGLRSTLMRKYARHFWPEDPLTAEPRTPLPRQRS